MKRFIDLRCQGTGYRFAWWDTTVDLFERHSATDAWNTWQEFVSDFRGADIVRYKELCPEWVFNEDRVVRELGPCDVFIISYGKEIKVDHAEKIKVTFNRKGDKR